MINCIMPIEMDHDLVSRSSTVTPKHISPSYTYNVVSPGLTAAKRTTNDASKTFQTILRFMRRPRGQ